jgi:hypothetical protein
MKKALLLCLLGFLTIACTNDNKEDLLGEEPTDCFQPGLSYQDDIKPILSANCGTSGCHSGPNAFGGLDLNTFSASAQIADNGNLVGRIKGTSGAIMPPGSPLGACEIEKIQAWVDDGAPNN